MGIRQRGKRKERARWLHGHRPIGGDILSQFLVLPDFYKCLPGVEKQFVFTSPLFFFWQLFLSQLDDKTRHLPSILLFVCLILR